jgi:hypothetical protein
LFSVRTTAISSWNTSFSNLPFQSLMLIWLHKIVLRFTISIVKWSTFNIVFLNNHGALKLIGLLLIYEIRILWSYFIFINLSIVKHTDLMYTHILWIISRTFSATHYVVNFDNQIIIDLKSIDCSFSGGFLSFAILCAFYLFLC